MVGEEGGEGETIRGDKKHGGWDTPAAAPRIRGTSTGRGAGDIESGIVSNPPVSYYSYHDAVLDSSHRRRPLAQPQMRHPEVHLGGGVLRIETRVRLERREALVLLPFAVVVERRLSVLEVRVPFNAINKPPLGIGGVIRGGALGPVRGGEEQGGEEEGGWKTGHA